MLTKKMQNNEYKKLLELACAVRANAYCPYSGFSVGAALLAKSGKIYCGCNVENVSFGAGTCAERAALGCAIAAGEREFIAIAVCAGASPTTPCGICRQALLEFGDMDVVCASADCGSVEQYRLSELMPGAFSHFDSD